MKRQLFIAIELPQEIKSQISHLITSLKREYSQMRWENSDKLHLTLKFLGNTDIEQEKILSALQKNLTGQKSFSVKFDRLNSFKNRETTLFLGLRSSAELIDLFSKTEFALSEMGFAKDNRPFHPHLTLGRSKTIVNKIKPVNIKLPPFTVDSITLYQSQLTKDGSIYTKLGQVKFK